MFGYLTSIVLITAFTLISVYVDILVQRQVFHVPMLMCVCVCVYVCVYVCVCVCVCVCVSLPHSLCGVSMWKEKYFVDK